MTAAGWYQADGDPPGTQRYWDGQAWVGEPTVNAPPVSATAAQVRPAGWLHADGDPPGTQRYWDGQAWVGEAVLAPAGAPTPAAAAADSNSSALIGKRFGARFVDLLIMVIILSVMVIVGLASSDAGGGVVSVDLTFGSQSLDSRLEYLLWGLISFGWSTAWLATLGATPGKALFGMKIVDQNRAALNPKTAALRSLNKLLPVLGLISVDAGEFGAMVFGTLLIGVPSMIMLIADSDNGSRTVMDRLTRTYVVNR